MRNTNDNLIECAGFLESSCGDGPGIRSVLFFQGCSLNCTNCHNACIKVHGKGTLMEIEKIVKYIDKKCKNKKITISGGDPLEQVESLVKLLSILREKDYDICVYPGRELNQVPKKVINLVDYLKTGMFVEKLRDNNLQYVGSSNQRMYKVENGILKEINLLVQEVA